MGPSRASANGRKPQRTGRRTVATVRMLSKLIESKNFDLLSTNTIVFSTSTATVVQTNVGIVQGTTPNTHIGRALRMTHLEHRWDGSLAPTSTGSSPLRILTVYDRQPNGALAATLDIMAIDAIYSAMNLNNSHRFQVICDSLVDCLGTQGPQAFIKVIERKLNHVVEYKGNAGTIADITTGALITLVWQNGNIGIATPLDALNSRIRFEDA